MPLGIPEIVVLLVILAVPVGLVLLVLFLVKITQRQAPPQMMIPPPTSGQRLKELDALKAENLVTAEEYEAKRKEILGEV
jgi:hypothetical protein